MYKPDAAQPWNRLTSGSMILLDPERVEQLKVNWKSWTRLEGDTRPPCSFEPSLELSAWRSMPDCV